MDVCLGLRSGLEAAIENQSMPFKTGRNRPTPDCTSLKQAPHEAGLESLALGLIRSPDVVALPQPTAVAELSDFRKSLLGQHLRE